MDSSQVQAPGNTLQDQTSSGRHRSPHRPPRRPKPAATVNGLGDSSTTPDATVPPQPFGNRRSRPSQRGKASNRGNASPKSAIERASEAAPGSGPSTTPRESGSPNKPPRRQTRPKHAHPTESAESGSTDLPPLKDESSEPHRKQPKRRGMKFNANLTDGPSQAPPPHVTDEKSSKKYRNTAPKRDDLMSTLIHSLRTPPYPDCLICFAAIHPAQPTWSCSPLIPIHSSTDDEQDKGVNPKRNETAQCCWSTFHLKCIRSWASKNVKDVSEAWRARGEARSGDWRCPGCQSKRLVVPGSYWCFCGSTPDPKPSRLATPHSCASPCSRQRACGHPCPELCHPGPCPSCQVTTQLPCYCGRQTLSFSCARLAPSRAGQGAAADLSCGRQCGKKLGCGNHSCEDMCHDGDCPPCSVTQKARCYCGKEDKELPCGIGIEKDSVVVEGEEEHKWIGRFECDNVCNRPFGCGVHYCSKPCHPPSPVPSLCPRSPSMVTHCPCGKHELSSVSSSAFPPGTLLDRTTCTDPIPTCAHTCMKPLEGCTHVCSAPCHLGPCPPCSIRLIRPCRCGATTRDVRCSDDQASIRARENGAAGEEILCNRPCGALRACGRHQCNRVCCPLASLASMTKGKGKKKASEALDAAGMVDEGGWHECDLICGKTLGCGNHQCEERDHRGACPPCYRSSFEEMSCNCGRTILEPPIPCGTRIKCGYPCVRPPLYCDHPVALHACHEDPSSCPPCVVLMTKQCACGKKAVDNVRCSQDRVSCGMTCGKLLACGFHHCERLCHGDSCGPCNAVCGKSRKLCLPAHHPCTQPCHAPSACSENEACRAVINVTCPCGRIRQPVACGRSTSNPAGREGSQQLKCTNECLMAKRNARLAEALGINIENRSDVRQQVTYHEDLSSFARANPKFCTMVEKTFSEFLSSNKKSQVLAHMPESRRKFVHDLAAVYRMDTQMVDQEPHRSVQLIRRIDSRIPSPLLSTACLSAPSSTLATPSIGLGKLADLRAPVARAPPGRSPSSTPAPTPASGSRGWTSVVARQPTPSPSPTAWLTAKDNPNPRPNSVRESRSPAPSSSRQPVPAVTTVPTANVAASVDVPDNWEDDA